MDLRLLVNPLYLLIFSIDIIFALLALLLIKKIFTNQHSISIRTPFFISIFSVFCLLFFYLTNNLTISNVWLNSHESTPLLYKIAGIWGNHEGSMLLFYMFLTAWAALLLKDLHSIRLSAFVLLALGGYLYFQANPFVILAIKAAAGQDLNPALQNPYLAIHPPILYAGQTLCFALWVMACVNPIHSKIQQYTRICFFFITLGLVLGARWAYGELGWGGFWFWDPVETVSLFPWLAIAAAVHAKKTDEKIFRNCLLISFPMVMLGLTLVRSGVLVSVHSFGFDLNNGIWLGLCTLAVSLISILVLYKNRSVTSYSFLARDLIPYGFLVMLGILVSLIIFPVFFKIFFGIELAIDENFFHQYINPFLLIALSFCVLAPQMTFQKIHLWNFICAFLGVCVWCTWAQPYFHLLAACSALISFWLIISTSNVLKHLFSKGFVASHLGIGLCILGASHSEIFTVKQEYDISKLPPTFASQPIRYQSTNTLETKQMTKEILKFNLSGKELIPERQHFHISHLTKHQPAWIQHYLDDIHGTCFVEQNKWKIELILKPYINIFWFGILFVLIGIAVSIRNIRLK